MPQGEEFALGGVHPVVAGRMNSDSSLLPGSEQVLSLCEVALLTLLEWDSLASLGPCGPGKDFPFLQCEAILLLSHGSIVLSGF